MVIPMTRKMPKRSLNKVAAFTLLLLVLHISMSSFAQEVRMEPSISDSSISVLMDRAELGDAEAQFALGLIYESGDDGGQDYTEARKWFRLAAEQGHASAQKNLGWMYRDAAGGSWDIVEARKWFLNAAEQGDASAQQDLGLSYVDYPSSLQDYLEAMKWCARAAEEGLPGAQNCVGVIYERGLGVEQDSAEAHKWFLMAGEQGYPASQANLAAHYFNGISVPVDIAAGRTWAQKAAQQGSPMGQTLLGVFYLRGNPELLPDPIQSYAWFGVAAAQGYEKAASSKGWAAAQLDAVSLAEAQALEEELYMNYVQPFEGKSWEVIQEENRMTEEHGK